MDEMNNMNEVTTEETSNEMTPVVTENNEVKTAENSGINTWAGIAAAVGVLTIGAIGAGIAKHKAKAKTEPKVEKEKYGWYDLRTAYIQGVSGGYVIRLPKPVALNN
jgi:hypothetical protein